MLARSNEPTGSGTVDGDDVAETRARQAAFGRASRHSRNVRLLKVALPLVAVAIAIAFPAYSYFAAPPAVPVQTDGTAYSNGKLVMANPKLDGFTRKNMPYSMTALRAIQDATQDGVIELEGIDATLPIDDNTQASIDAKNGTYDRDKNTLKLNGDVAVKTNDGLVAKFKSVYLDMGEGSMKTDDPIDISRNGSRITSDSMSVQDNGKVLVFENKVRVNIDPSKLKADKKESGDQNASQ